MLQGRDLSQPSPNIGLINLAEVSEIGEAKSERGAGAVYRGMGPFLWVEARYEAGGLHPPV